MTYLQLCQKLRQECGIAGSGPSTVTGQTGELARIVDWIKDAWLEIQGLHTDWKFLRTSASWATVAGQGTYTLAQCGITSFSAWVKEYGNFRCYITASGTPSELFLNEMTYEQLRATWYFGSNRDVTQRPYDYAVMDNDGIALGPKPTVGHTILADYYSAPVELTADADVPALPAKHSAMIIVYAAMMKYGRFQSAPEVFTEGKEGYTKLLRALRNDQLPNMNWG